ncbi:MAG TPA: homocysteine S-methyltransferase family protein [Thermohalobaculum sp.]|nr:homocysteine S-methyltransferase family protein [Thermohalobaculum sp.]
MTRITLLDGGMGQELIRRSPAEPTPLWSAEVMLHFPELVKAVHLAYIEAGARVITVNAYSCTRDRLQPHGAGDQFEALQKRACELAKAARDASGEAVSIAGCLPPLMWSYRPELANDPDEVAPVYAEIAALQAPHVDLFLCETMSHSGQALGAVRGALEGGGGKPVWVSWTLRDDGAALLRSDETVGEAAARLEGLAVGARLVNCSVPEAVGAAMPHLAALGGRFGGYANGFTGISPDYAPGTTVKTLRGREDLGPTAYAKTVMGWVEAGARIVGGCCEIGPEHIATLAHHLGEAGYAITGAGDG